MELFLIIVAILIIMSVVMFLDLQSKNKQPNTTPKPLQVSDNIPSKKGHTIIKVTTLEKYIQGAVIDEKTMDLLNEAILDNKEYILIPTKKLYELEKKRNEYLEKRINK